MKESMDSLTLADAYRAIYGWYTANKNVARREYPSWADEYVAVIDNLPAPERATGAEMKAVMSLVNTGCMEWAFRKSDGRHMMGDYARGIRRTLGAEADPSPDEVTQLRSSKLWPFLRYSRREEAD